MRSIIAVFLLFAIVLVSCKEEGPCGTFQKCSEKADESIRTISYCARTEDGGYETKKAAPKCWRHLSKCMQMNPNQNVILHKGECSNCTMENVCRLNVESGRMNKRMAKLYGIWKYPVCNRKGEVKFKSMCDFHMARCEAVKEADQPLPEGGTTKFCPKSACEKYALCLMKPKKDSMKYCAKVGEEYQTQEIPLKCWKRAIDCMKSKPDQQMILHKGECGDCSDENVCHVKPKDPKAFRVGGKGRVQKSKIGKKRLGGIWRRPVCNADGEKEFATLCEFHKARCEANVNEDEDIPQGSICKVTTCQKLNECLKSKPGRMGTMDYCAKTEDGNETKKMPRKCIKIALACIHSEPEQEMMLHLGECKNCDEENVCLSKTDLREYQIGGRRKVMNKMKPPVWMKPVCKADGEKLFENLCDYYMARCEAVKDDKPLPEGGDIKSCMKNPCIKLDICMRKNANKRSISYCSTATGTEKIPLKCLKLALECMKSEPEQEMMLHLGKCENCDEENVCPLYKAIMKFKVCGDEKLDGDEKLGDMNLCQFNVKRCEAYKNRDDIPQGKLCDRKMKGEEENKDEEEKEEEEKEEEEKEGED